MASNNAYDLCIVGAGLIGSAAAQHASKWGKVCLIGPEEPKEKRSISNRREIYGAHYDEGRLTRKLASDPIWATLAQRSIARYRSLEKESGIDFYTEVGTLIIGTEGSDYMSKNESVIKEQNLKIDTLTFLDMKKKFPYLNVSDDDYGMMETTDAGYISPRSLVKAQITVAVKNGCIYNPDVVNDVRRIVEKGNYLMVVQTDRNTIFAKRVLLATGAFTPFRNILPSGLQLDLRLRPITVAKVKISTSDYKDLRTMPGMIYDGKGARDWTPRFPRDTDSDNISWYMLPPVKYPDGKYYLKLGHFHNAFKVQFSTIEEMKAWFCSYGPPDLVDTTAELITNVIKGVNKVSHQGDCCVITQTSTDRPYIDMVHSQLGVAVGGNGYAAKSSDEIGRLAAVMIMKNEWDSTISRDAFRVKFKGQQAKL